MNALTRSGPAIARRWVKAYTRGLPEGARDSRRAEVDSDIWEHLHDSSRRAPGLEIFLRSILGIPADLTWRLEQATFGERLTGMFAAILGRLERLTSWVVQRGLPGLTTALAWLFVAGGVLLILLTPFQAPDGRGIAVLGAWGILAGLAIRWGRPRIPQRPIAGYAAVFAGAAPLGAILVVTVLVPIIALVVVVNEGRRSWRAWRTSRQQIRIA
ncbi:MAG: hypothetical protein AB7N24_19060 [Dehalococcoidia bacterium]